MDTTPLPLLPKPDCGGENVPPSVAHTSQVTACLQLSPPKLE